jgi:hypothetical protein
MYLYICIGCEKCKCGRTSCRSGCVLENVCQICSNLVTYCTDRKVCCNT